MCLLYRDVVPGTCKFHDLPMLQLQTSRGNRDMPGLGAIGGAHLHQELDVRFDLLSQGMAGRQDAGLGGINGEGGAYVRSWLRITIETFRSRVVA